MKPELIAFIVEGVELGLRSIAGLVKASRAKTLEEEAAALAELDGVIEDGNKFVGRLRAELAAGDARVDAAAATKFGEKP